MAINPLSARERQEKEHNHVAPHTHEDALPSKPGFMSGADKGKLDGIATEASKNQKANPDQAKEGVNDDNFLTPFTGKALVQEMAPGALQDHIDVTALRVNGGTYTNDTGRMIAAYVFLNDTGVGNSTFRVNGKSIPLGDFGAGRWMHTFLIPPGHEYGVTLQGAMISSWWEVR